MDKVSIVNQISEAYTSLSKPCKEALAAKIAVVSVGKGEVLVRQGQYTDKIFYLIAGAARAYYLKDGKDISDWFAFEGEFISAINGFFLGIPSPHYIESLEESTYLQLSRADVDTLSDKYHDFERLSKVIVIQTMLKQQQRIASLQFHSAAEKYHNILAAIPNIDQRVPLMHIASYIGITLETLSRIRSQPRRN